MIIRLEAIDSRITGDPNLFMFFVLYFFVIPADDPLNGLIGISRLTGMRTGTGTKNELQQRKKTNRIESRSQPPLPQGDAIE